MCSQIKNNEIKGVYYRHICAACWEMDGLQKIKDKKRMKLDMLKTVHHVQRTRVFTSQLHSVKQCNFVSNADIKQQFLEGLKSTSVCDAHLYAQLVFQGVKKNEVYCKNSGWNVGTSNRIGKIPNMGTHAGAHKVTNV